MDEGAFQRTGARPEDTDGIINFPRAIVGVCAVVFLKQWEPGVVRVSLRSKGRVDVQSVAAQFGGGGHLNAAGCSMTGDLHTARRLVVDALVQTLTELP